MNKKTGIDLAIQVLEWCIQNKKKQSEGLSHFNLNESFIRKGKKKAIDDKDPRAQVLESLQRKVESSIYVNRTDFDDPSRDTIIDKNTVEWKQDQGILDAKGKNHVKTLDQIISEAKIDLRVWSVDRHVINKWDVTNKLGKTYQNWQVKVWLSKREEVQQVIDHEKMYKELLASHKPVKYQTWAYPKITEHNLLEINIFDLHIGKLCWSDEVNNNYDTKIAKARFVHAIETLVQRVKGYQFERIVFPVGNDFFNVDNHINTTTQGTRQDEDSRWQKTFRTGVHLLVYGIDVLRQLAPVDVLVIPGNHDGTKSFFLGETLAAWYRDDKCVKVNNSANPRKYYEYGNVLIGYTHGNNEKHEALRSLMAHESREAWARTIYKEFHVGHQHRKLSEKHVVKSDFLKEELGVVIRAMSSLAGTDSWHHTMGYVGPVRAAEAFLWNKQTGLIGNFNVNIKLNDDL